MGEAVAKLTLGNFGEQQLGPITVDAIADTGAVLTCIPEEIAMKLRLQTVEDREVRLADGKLHTCRYVGPLMIRFENRSSLGAALVLGDEVLLGATSMEDMDLIVIPKTRRVAVNPEHPDRGGHTDPLIAVTDIDALHR